MNILKPHVSLNVTDLDASVAFYEKAFGVAATKRRPGYAKFDLIEPSLNFSMVQAPRTGVNASHFGVQVASTADVVAAKARLEAAGLATRTEEDTACCYAVQDKVWVEDPDGNAWEFFVVKADADVMKDDGGTCCAPAGATPGTGADAVVAAASLTGARPGGGGTAKRSGGGCCG